MSHDEFQHIDILKALHYSISSVQYDQAFVATSTGLYARLVFANLALATDDSKLARIKQDTKRIGQIGEIKLTVYRASLDTLCQDQHTRDNAHISDLSHIHERALKGQAKSHSTV